MKPSFRLLTASLLLVSGCSHQQQSIPLPEKTSLHVSSLNEINCMAMPVSDDKLQFSTRLNPASLLALSSGNTPFVAYSLPAGTSEISIKSMPLNTTKRYSAEIFAPQAALLDHNNQVIRTIKNFTYQKPGILSSESLKTTIKLNHIEDQHAACLLIYTTDEARLTGTPLMNEAKEYARVRGLVPPPVPDVVARHGNNGELSLSIKISETPALAPRPPAPLPPANPDSFDSAMGAHYLGGTRTAIAEKNIKKALSLRTEFNNIIESIEGYFISQYGKKRDQIVEPRSYNKESSKESGFADKAIYHYQSQTYRYLTTGQASSALKLQDSLKHMQREMDAIFNQI